METDPKVLSSNKQTSLKIKVSPLVAGTTLKKRKKKVQIFWFERVDRSLFTFLLKSITIFHPYLCAT